MENVVNLDDEKHSRHAQSYSDVWVAWKSKGSASHSDETVCYKQGESVC